MVPQERQLIPPVVLIPLLGIGFSVGCYHPPPSSALSYTTVLSALFLPSISLWSSLPSLCSWMFPSRDISHSSLYLPTYPSFSSCRDLFEYLFVRGDFFTLSCFYSFLFSKPLPLGLSLCVGGMLLGVSCMVIDLAAHFCILLSLEKAECSIL